jgi:phage-related minor tail protein
LEVKIVADSKIKGINIKFGSDMSGVVTQINTLTTESKKAATELKQINKLLKVDPENVELLNQKMSVLGQQVDKLEVSRRLARELG